MLSFPQLLHHICEKSDEFCEEIYWRNKFNRRGELEHFHSKLSNSLFVKSFSMISFFLSEDNLIRINCPAAPNQFTWFAKMEAIKAEDLDLEVSKFCVVLKSI